MRIKNWEKFQHYKDRNPPWIKLHNELQNDPDWHDLSGDAAKLLVNLWMIASDYATDGSLPDSRKLAFRLRTDVKTLEKLIRQLSHWLILDASGMLADRLQGACPETETETETEGEGETEGETEAKIIVSKKRASRKTITTTMTGEFELWWGEYPHKVGKRDAMTAFANALLRGATLDALLSGVRQYRSAKPPDRQWCNPATWLNQDRYLDQPAPPVGHGTVGEQALRIWHELKEEQSGNIIDISPALNGGGRRQICDGSGEQLPAVSAAGGSRSLSENVD